jgi:urease subunit alpha
MLHNTATPTVEVQPEPVPVRVDGVEVPLRHARDLPLTGLHHLG